jgi:putative protease
LSTLSTQTTELLAPAGDWEALRAAVANGADAVYFGLSNFNARHRATNFTLEELPEVLGFLHERNVRGYVTCNTLIFSAELPEIARTIAAIAEAGADAVIVQDLGLARLIARLAPGLPVHGSTQMTLTEPRAIEFVRSLGVERVILARELSLQDIEQITRQTEMPVEVFVHGALCVAYSGQCLTSEALGGRSANRGQCAQACRLPYELIVDGAKKDLGDVAYLLSPQDLASHDLIDSLVRLGVASLKIEGRLKSAQYVAVTTQTYRAALDAAIDERPFELSRQGQLDLAQSFSRGFAPGFLAGIDHQRLVHGKFPKSRGVKIGTVVTTTSRGVLVELAADHTADVVRPGDGIVFDEGHPEQDEQGGRIYEVRPAHLQRGEGVVCVELMFGLGALQLAALSPGATVWKTDDPQLRKRMAQTYTHDTAVKHVPLAFAVSGRPGGPLSIIARDGRHEVSAQWPGPMQVAIKHPLGEQLLREQLGRLGDTPFAIGEITTDLPEPVMAPKSVLNELRRTLVEQLLAVRSSSTKRTADLSTLETIRQEVASAPRREPLPKPQLYVMARTLEQLDAVLAWSAAAPAIRPAMVYVDFEDVRRYREAVTRTRAADMPIGLATLRVIKPGEEGLLQQIALCEGDAVLVRNLASLSYYQEAYPQLPLIGDYALNVANELSADLFRQQGLARLVPSYDLNWEQLADMVARIDAGLFELVVHQHMPMFHMEHCVIAHTLSSGKDSHDCGRPCDRHRIELRDRAGAAFPLVADTGCRNTVYNSIAQSAAEFVPRMLGLGLRHFRVELLREEAAQVAPLLDRYSRVLCGLDDGRTTWRGLQILNQLGVTRGTLQMS